MTMALVLLLLFGGSWLGVIEETTASHRVQDQAWLDEFLQVGLNPVRAWWYAGFSWQDCANAWANGDYRFWNRILAVLAGSLLYALGAAMFWRLSCRRFERRADVVKIHAGRDKD